MSKVASISSWAVACIILVTLASAAINWTYHSHVADQLDRIEQKDPKMLTTKWMSGGMERSWTSTQAAGETIKALGDRHALELVDLFIKYPADV